MSGMAVRATNSSAHTNQGMAIRVEVRMPPAKASASQKRGISETRVTKASEDCEQDFA